MDSGLFLDDDKNEDDVHQPSEEPPLELDQQTKENMDKILQSAPSLGLNLDLTSSFLERIEASINQREAADNSALIIPASLIRIGEWQRKPINERDMLVKFCHNQRRMVWELTDLGLTSKIEIEWDDVSALHAEFEENRPGILLVEVKVPPRIYHELGRKQYEIDLTGGEANKCRRHFLEFPPGVIKRPYENLIQSDLHLRHCSQIPTALHESHGFPTLLSSRSAKGPGPDAKSEDADKVERINMGQDQNLGDSSREMLQASSDGSE